jgi:hypothetical protein
MKALLFPIALCIAVSTSSVSDAQGGVRDGSTWTGGGMVIAMDIGFTSTEGVVTAQAISASGWSNTTNGTEGANHSDEHASCDDSGVMYVPTETGTMAVTCTDGRVERWDGQRWVPMWRRIDANRQLMDRGEHPPGGGEEVVTLPWTLYDEVSFEWWRAQQIRQAEERGRAARRN